jgi:5-methyltetrahydropteroyltriglutamate--homocysteine methyltransferase
MEDGKLIRSCDAGSLPFFGSMDMLSRGAEDFSKRLGSEQARFFERLIITAFSDKLRAGITIPSFPQLRDMSDMYTSSLDGVGKTEGGYVTAGDLSVKADGGIIPEVQAIAKNAEKIYGEIDKPFQMAICVTGPYTLASLFRYKTGKILRKLGEALSSIVESNIFNLKQGTVSLVTIDEPLFGVLDDPLIDRGSEGRENLLKAWETLASRARNRKADACIHLHSTSDDLFWSVESLSVIESHVEDPIYKSKATKQHLMNEDKFLKASIAITDFDKLIKAKLNQSSLEKLVADVWKEISAGKAKPETFLEDVQSMKKRLSDILEQFGSDRVTLVGPECGLRGFPTYVSAIECLRRVSTAAQENERKS